MSVTAQLQRVIRKWHGKVSAVAFIFFFFISVTGILLGWKDLFASKIYTSAGKQVMARKVGDWLPLDSLQQIAVNDLRQRAPSAGEAKVITLNARLDKGFVRFTFDGGYNVQLNARSGELQSIEKKATDLFIKIHDGEILDELFNTKSGAIKTSYTSLLGLALFFLTLTGFWMRYGRKKSLTK
jgi:uncharacterized iron-regulated membrane protein